MRKRKLASMWLSGLLIVAQTSQGTPPPVLPPYAEFRAPLECSGPPAEADFVPGLGGFMTTVGGTKGPSHGAFTNLATLDFLYLPDADVNARSEGGGKTSFRRAYRSDLAFAGTHSPGMALGWTHNYDVTIEPSKDTERWRAMKMLWPNGAVEKVSPMLDASGVPTGEFVHQPGQPFAMKGEPGSGLNQWRSITIYWPGGYFWKFDPHASGSLVLRETGSALSPLVGLRMGYDPERRLLEITVTKDRTPVVQLAYTSGLLSRVDDVRAGTYRNYGYSTPTPGGAVALTKVTDLGGKAAAKAYFTYAYGESAGTMLLNGITIPHPTTGTTGMKVEYTKGNVSAMIDGNGNRKEFKRK